MGRWLWMLGGLGCAGVPLAFALLVSQVLDEREYLIAVGASLSTYAIGLWAAERAGRFTPR